MKSGVGDRGFYGICVKTYVRNIRKRLEQIADRRGYGEQVKHRKSPGDQNY